MVICLEYFSEFFSSDCAGQPSFRNFPSFVSEKPEHENLPKQLRSGLGQSTVRKRHKDVSTIHEIRKSSQLIPLSP